MKNKNNTINSEWKDKLKPDEYRVLRERGTEPPFSGMLLNNKEKGVYSCKACGNELFSSGAKYDSGSGWPSFFESISGENIKLEKDGSMGMERTEVICAKCGSHLGHVFPDGPNPTGERYCINSLSLDFKKPKDDKE